MLKSAYSICVVVMLCGPAFAHDPDTGNPNWITEGAYRGKDGVHCCGPNDCERLKPDRVKVTPRGYLLPDYGMELVPFSEATPSEDGMYWRCHEVIEPGKRRCFFAPMPGH